jgi:hypothetical protein
MHPRKHNQKMQIPPPKHRSAYGTYLYLTEADLLEYFLQDYRQILTTQFQKVRIESGGEYRICGQHNDPRNCNWKPWQHFERLCRKRGLDDFAVRDIIVEHLGRNLECDCEVLFDEGNLPEESLKRQFVADFDSGEIGLLD